METCTRRQFLKKSGETAATVLIIDPLEELARLLANLSPEKNLQEIITLFRNHDWKVAHRNREWFMSPPKETRRQLAFGDWYLGKEWNANEAALAIMRHFDVLLPGQTYSLIGDGVIDFTGKVTQLKYGPQAELPNWIIGHYDGGVWGGGACWAVSTWGAAHDDFNTAFREVGFNFNPIDNKSFGNATHPHLYKSYQPMENWDNPRLWKTGGYTIYQAGNGSAAVDYTIRINPSLATILPHYFTYLSQNIQFHWGQKPYIGLARENTSFMLSRVSLVIEPLDDRNRD